MYHLIYTSHAIQSFEEDELIQLLKQSQEYNKEHRITGMLLYLNGKFIQVLEGKKEEVLNLYEGIFVDPRHHRVIMIMEGTSQDRMFKNWSMGFKHISYSDFHSLTGYKDIDHFFADDVPKEKGNLLLTFLTLFYKKNITDYADAQGIR